MCKQRKSIFLLNPAWRIHISLKQVADSPDLGHPWSPAHCGAAPTSLGARGTWGRWWAIGGGSDCSSRTRLVQTPQLNIRIAILLQPLLLYFLQVLGHQLPVCQRSPPLPQEHPHLRQTGLLAWTHWRRVRWPVGMLMSHWMRWEAPALEHKSPDHLHKFLQKVYISALTTWLRAGSGGEETTVDLVLTGSSLGSRSCLLSSLASPPSSASLP